MSNKININIKDYAAKTKFDFHELDIPFVNKEEVVPMGLDVGYSATKVYSLFGKHIFPSLPIRVSSGFTMAPGPNDIRYKDEEGNVWYVGNLAREYIEDESISTQSGILYGRQRIKSHEYLVLLRIGLFLGLIEEDLGDSFKLSNPKKILIKTGLPEQYINRDRETLKNRFIGHHFFEIKIGDREWQKVSIDIEDNDISVISQPFGTLWSLVANKQGDLVDTELLKKRVLIYDGGQHTTDTYYNKSGQRGSNTTWENLSMMEVIRNVLKRVNLETGGQGEFQEYAFDKLVSSDINPGRVVYKRRQYYDFTNDVAEETERVAKEAMEQLDITYNYLNEIDVLVLTGGIGKAFYNHFAEYYNLDGLEVRLAENINPEDKAEEFTAVMANSSGFFNCLIAEIKAELEPEYI